MDTTIDWYGCATFMLHTAGMHIMLDAYVDRSADAAGPGLRAEDVTACDWIVIGHSHFDHLYGAERIAPATGARIIGSYETIRVMEQAGVPLEQMICVSGGETVDLGNGVRVTAYPSQHSCVWSHQQMGQPAEVCLGELGVTWQEQNQKMQELMGFFATGLSEAGITHFGDSQVGHSDRGDGGALVYVFETPDGSLFYQDTSGHWSGVLADLSPDVAIIAAAGRGNINGEPIQGSLAQFVAQQVQLLNPTRVILSHHDDWLPGFSIDTDTGPIRDAIAALDGRAELVELGYMDAHPVF